MNLMKILKLVQQGGAKFLIASAALGFCGLSVAETYFVDPNGGQDNYSGTAPSFTTGVRGPWQTLSRLASANLQPLDTVYLACNGVWNETLKLKSSGGNATPITIASGPGNCLTPPTIDGAIAVPAHQWVKHSGSIYRAKLPLDLIANPNPGPSLIGWTSWAANGDAAIATDIACPNQQQPCMAFTSGVSNSTAISNEFPISGGVEYTAGVQVRAPAGSQIKVVLRRGGRSYEPLAPVQWITAVGVWQSVGFMFTASHSAPNARLDIEAPGSRVRINVREAHVKRTGALASVIAAYVDDLQVRRAHHPNFGEGTASDSPYAPIAADGGKTSLNTTGLALPPGALLAVGMGVTMRTINWAIEERTVAAVIGRQLVLSAPTDYPVTQGYGYFLTGALWMLDSPGEWFFDESTSTVYIWMPDGAAPGDRVSLGALAIGAELRSKSNINVNNIAFRHVGTGVSLGWGRAVALSGVGISDVSDYGVNAENCTQCRISGSSVTRSGLDAITAIGALAGDFSVTDSSVVDSGVSKGTGGWRTLPRPAKSAIHVVGAGASVLRNRVDGSANAGINMGVNGNVSYNHVTRTCLMLNDCGAIYANHGGNSSQITGNVVETVPGNLAGLPGNPQAQTVGIYLDDRNANSVVSNNTVVGAEYGIQLHDAHGATVSNNTLFGNRRHQIWLQEHTGIARAAGDVFGNSIVSNLLVPDASGPALYLVSEYGSTGDFATFSGNHYSGLLIPRVIGERSRTAGGSYSVSEWQAAGRETSARVTQPVGYATFLTGSSNLIPNGDLFSGTSGWTSWNPVMPIATASVTSCGQAPCIRLVAGGSPSLLSSPNFSLVEGQWYRVTFDAVTSHNGQAINALVLRGGGGTAGYEYLIPAAESFVGSTSWRRYSFSFQALKTINADDPVTMERGARIDFERNLPGTTLTVARLEMVKLTTTQTPMQIKMLLNPGRSVASITCESLGVPASTCGTFAYVSDERPVEWPATVAPLSGRPIYTRDVSLTDGDQDGIANQQDICPGTVAGKAVNAKGCSIDQ